MSKANSQLTRLKSGRGDATNQSIFHLIRTDFLQEVTKIIMSILKVAEGAKPLRKPLRPEPAGSLNCQKRVF